MSLFEMIDIMQEEKEILSQKMIKEEEVDKVDDVKTALFLKNVFAKGKEMASKYDLVFSGWQEGAFKVEDGYYMFIDKETETTFTISDESEMIPKLTKVRKSFGNNTPVKGVA